MVAEVDLYWIVYERCLGSTVDLPKVQDALREWKRQWSFVLGTVTTNAAHILHFRLIVPNRPTPLAVS